jgi:hypothetical protein
MGTGRFLARAAMPVFMGTALALLAPLVVQAAVPPAAKAPTDHMMAPKLPPPVKRSPWSVRDQTPPAAPAEKPATTQPEPQREIIGAEGQA